MAGGFDLAEDAGNAALAIEQKRGALDSDDLLAVHVLLFQHFVEQGQIALFVGQQRIRNLLGVLELLLGFDAVGAYAEPGGL